MKLSTLACLLALGLHQTTFAEDASAFQYSTIDALLAGSFEGDLTVGDLKKKGNFGLGTYNRVDGEMIVLDGVFYKAKGDGTVVVVGNAERTPFAVVTQFAAVNEFPVTGFATLKELESFLDTKLVNPNAFYAIRVEGEFKDIRTRAIIPQNRPYRPLAEVVKSEDQKLFDMHQKKGTLIAFRSPAFSKGFNIPGYHWHFLEAGAKSGGHVLTLAMGNGSIKVSPITTIELKLPSSADFANADQTKDRSGELQTVEKERK